jgi:hypothetical protein
MRLWALDDSRILIMKLKIWSQKFRPVFCMSSLLFFPSTRGIGHPYLSLGQVFATPFQSQALRFRLESIVREQCLGCTRVVHLRGRYTWEGGTPEWVVHLRGWSTCFSYFLVEIGCGNSWKRFAFSWSQGNPNLPWLCFRRVCYGQNLKCYVLMELLFSTLINYYWLFVIVVDIFGTIYPYLNRCAFMFRF